MLLLCVDISRLIKYYTDWYDVDEDMATISLQSGSWVEETMTGITRRGIDINSTTTFEYVASVQKKNKQDLLTKR